VVNTTASWKAVKVRFLEGKRSKEVLDFNLYMSPFDVWTGAVVPVGATGALGAKLVTADNSCTLPKYVNDGTFYFKNYAYTDSTGASTDGETNALDRTNEGYFEIIEMGDITNTKIQAGITHSNGVPANCAVLAPPTGTGILSSDVVFAAQFGSLMGTGTLINVNNGVDYGYNPVVLDDFAESQIYADPGNILPNLGSVNPTTSTVMDGFNVTTTNWASTLITTDAVTAVLMHDNVLNEFMMDTATASGTDWIVTLPTKWNYVGVDTLNSSKVRQNTPATRPFQRNFWNGGACDDITIVMHDREEASAPSVIIPSPPPPTAQGSVLCWEANVLTFINGAGVASNNMGSVNLSTVNYKYQNGWAQLSFPLLTVAQGYPNAHRLPSPVNATSVNFITVANATYYGLPTVGFMVQDFSNGNILSGSTTVLSNYGGNFDHKNTRRIQ
jgi:hypothetical protein